MKRTALALLAESSQWLRVVPATTTTSVPGDDRWRLDDGSDRDDASRHDHDRSDNGRDG